jgi:hypothetical protein
MAVVQTISAPLPEAELGPPMFPGDRLLAQLRCEAPLVALDGDRFVLRRESPVETIGGGVVLDAQAPRVRRRDLPRVRAELLRLRGDAPAAAVQRGLAEGPMAAALVSRAIGAAAASPTCASASSSASSSSSLSSSLTSSSGSSSPHSTQHLRWQ